jgi:hypothetical protein
MLIIFTTYNPSHVHVYNPYSLLDELCCKVMAAYYFFLVI